VSTIKTKHCLCVLILLAWFLVYLTLNNKNAKPMKHIALLMFALLTITISESYAQDYRDRIGNLMGRVDSDGTVRDKIGNSIGRIDSDGTIRNRIGNSVGRIDRDGVFRDRIGNSIGRIDKDGTVRDRIGNQIGRIDDDGAVRDHIGNRVGSSNGIPKEWVAAIYFFEFFNP